LNYDPGHHSVTSDRCVAKYMFISARETNIKNAIEVEIVVTTHNSFA